MAISAGLIITQLGLFFVLQLRQLFIAVTLDCTATVTLTLTHTYTHTHSQPYTHFEVLDNDWNAIEMRLLTHSTRARNSIWIFQVISRACCKELCVCGEEGEWQDKELPPATTNKWYRHLTDCSNSWFCEKLTKPTRTSVRKVWIHSYTRTHSSYHALHAAWWRKWCLIVWLFTKIASALQISLFFHSQFAQFPCGPN